MKPKATLLSLHYCSSYKFLSTPQLNSSDKSQILQWLWKNLGADNKFKFQVLENGSLSDASEHH